MTVPVTTVRTGSTSTAGSSHRGTRFTMTAYKAAGETDPRWVMGNTANRAELLGTHARSQRTGLDSRTRRPPGAIRQATGPGAGPGEQMRLFVAIAPPPAVLDELDAQAAPLRAGREDLRWTNREAWHVTLAFLGQVDESAAARLLPRLERAAQRHHVFRLAFCGAGAFPALAKANVLWSGLSGDRRALASLAQSVAAGASRAGAPPPDKGRRFQPHLTLARCRMPVDVTELVAALVGYQGQPWMADRIHLVRSRLGATELPRYATLGSWPLRAGGEHEQALRAGGEHEQALRAGGEQEEALRAAGRGADPAP
jgi:RNA 2',3'-cyclic 3'-phosphodiesterase